MLCVWAALQRSLCALRRAERWTRSHGLRGKDGRMSTHHFHRFHGIQPTIPALSHSPGPRFRRRLQGRYIPGGLSESGSTHPSRPSAPYADAGRRPRRHPHLLLAGPGARRRARSGRNETAVGPVRSGRLGCTAVPPMPVSLTPGLSTGGLSPLANLVPGKKDLLD